MMQEPARLFLRPSLALLSPLLTNHLTNAAKTPEIMQTFQKTPF
jgi:hypothetical protein